MPKLRTPRYQLLENSPYENYNLYRSTASRNISGTLGTGDQREQRCPTFDLRMLVYNPSSTVPAYFIPAPQWLQYIQYFTPSGVPVATQDGQGV